MVIWQWINRLEFAINIYNNFNNEIWHSKESFIVSKNISDFNVVFWQLAASSVDNRQYFNNYTNFTFKSAKLGDSKDVL